MPLFCMCSATVLERRPNGDIPDSPEKAILPEYAMRCIKTGMAQFFRFAPEEPVIPQFPNLDVFECRICGARVAKDK